MYAALEISRATLYRYFKEAKLRVQLESGSSAILVKLACLIGKQCYHLEIEE
jgi:predicted site-specific integrase-resolvase